MTDPDRHDRDESVEAQRESVRFRDALASAARGSGLGQVAPGEIPTAGSLLTAVGGVRGLVEAILPGLAFLVLYSTTKNLALSVVAPVIVAVFFVALRLATRSVATQALAGVIGVAVSAGLALFTGRAEANFLVGILINVASFAIIVVSLVARYPVIGLVVGVLSNEGIEWRKDAGKRRVLTLATVLWAGLFAVRLGVEVPLYLAGQVEVLGVAKLVLGVPFYAAMLWVTWLLVRTVYATGKAAPPSPTP